MTVSAPTYSENGVETLAPPGPVASTRPVTSPYWAALSFAVGSICSGTLTVAPAGTVTVRASSLATEERTAEPSFPVTPWTLSESLTGFVPELV